MGTEGNSGRGREERNRKGKYWEGVESKKVAARSMEKHKRLFCLQTIQ